MYRYQGPPLQTSFSHPQMDPTLSHAKVLRDYQKAADDELSLYEGETLTKVTPHSDGWCYGENWHGRSGLLPSSHVKLLDDSDDESSRATTMRAGLRGHSYWPDIGPHVEQASLPRPRDRLKPHFPTNLRSSGQASHEPLYDYINDNFFESDMQNHDSVDATQSKGRTADTTQADFLRHCSGQRVNTDAVITGTLRKRYPHKLITVVPANFVAACDLLAYAASGHASASSLDEDDPMTWHEYVPPARRFDGSEGAVAEKIIFGKFKYAYGKHDLLLYVVDARDGPVFSPHLQMQYVVGGTEDVVQDLILKAGAWAGELHKQIWV